ncbi:MAG: hypothetical protein IJU53_09675 [Thermoguttaceae bacterium]|nr:hypothetical protein [Thermoguttaceae bacterium]
MRNIFRDETGSLTLEWIFLFSLLVLGIVGGVATLRNAMILEAGESAGAAAGLDDSYTVAPPPALSLDSQPSATINGFEYDTGPNKVKFGDSTGL